MKERPILFNGAMVRAVLSGQKTQTRRIVKPQPAHSCRYEMNGAGTHALHLAGGVTGTDEPLICVPPTPKSADHRLPCPFGVPGDRLWVRESFMPAPDEAAPDEPRPTLWNVAYAADGGQRTATAPAGYNPMLYNYERWTPSIHMPRWASRISLEVTDVRVERLQAISEKDAKSEGVTLLPLTSEDCWGDGTHKTAFEYLWGQVYGFPDEKNDGNDWRSNPWVWVVSFKRVEAKAVAA